MKHRRIAIIGGGYSGAMLAAGLLRHTDASVTLIERGERVARGAAYGTRHPEHLLNVRAARMSALADQPDHFADWLRARGKGDAASFAQRRSYGAYLEELLSGFADERLHIVKDEAMEIVRAGQCERIALRGSGMVEADAIVLSVGNLPPDRLRAIPAEIGPGIYIEDPWSGDIGQGFSSADRVLLVGTGLTAIDAALMLDAAGFGGEILAVSRRGLVPRTHYSAPHAVAQAGAPAATELNGLLREVRRAGESIGWQAAVDQLRPHTQALWMNAPVEQRQRFLRHLRPWWDVHRHRIAPEIAARLAAMERDRRLRFAAGKLLQVEVEGAGAVVRWRPRGSEEAETLRVTRIVNCTGPRGDVRRSGEALLESLVEQGRIRPDPCRIGIDVDEQCRALDTGGEPSESLYAIGPMTRGALWEIVAVPDLRVQVDALARRLA